MVLPSLLFVQIVVFAVAAMTAVISKRREMLRGFGMSTIRRLVFSGLHL